MWFPVTCDITNCDMVIELRIVYAKKKKTIGNTKMEKIELYVCFLHCVSKAESIFEIYVQNLPGVFRWRKTPQFNDVCPHWARVGIQPKLSHCVRRTVPSSRMFIDGAMTLLVYMRIITLVSHLARQRRWTLTSFVWLRYPFASFTRINLMQTEVYYS